MVRGRRHLLQIDEIFSLGRSKSDGKGAVYSPGSVDYYLSLGGAYPAWTVKRSCPVDGYASVMLR